MWIYEKKLEYPVKITRPNAALAKVIITQLGGPDFKFFKLILFFGLVQTKKI
jgi:Mn-containing catalase